MNRLDEIILFKPLTKDNIGSIVDLMMKDLNQRLADQELTLELDPILQRTTSSTDGYDPVYGARPLKRYLQKNVETLAAKLILSGKVGMEDTIVFTVRDGELTADVKPKGRDRDSQRKITDGLQQRKEQTQTAIAAKTRLTRISDRQKA